MTTGKALDGKPYAGNPHVRFDEGEVAPAATPRRGSLLYKKLLMMIGATTVAVGANAATGIIYGPDADGLTWTNVVVSGANVKLTGSSGNNTVAFDAAKVPWMFTVDGVEYTVTQIGTVFKNWKNLTGDLSIPDVVTTLGSIESTGIASLSIGSGASSIPNYWAKNADSLEFLVVPSTVTSIGVQLVYGCDKIKALHYHATGRQRHARG